MTGVENSTRAHRPPFPPPPLSKSVLYPTYAEREGAMNSSIVLHSCHLVTYKQRKKFSILLQGNVSLKNLFKDRINSPKESVPRNRVPATLNLLRFGLCSILSHPSSLAITCSTFLNPCPPTARLSSFNTPLPFFLM